MHLPTFNPMAWRKSWAGQNLEPDGTKRQLTPAQRSVWDDLLDLAETMHEGGRILVRRGVGYTTEQLAQTFNSPVELVKECLALFNHERSMIEIDKNGIITIKKWAKYQSEYDRVKAWRELGRAKQRTASDLSHGN